MSAVVVLMPQVLPRVWATASACQGARKGPQSLRLVRAQEDAATALPVRAIQRAERATRLQNDGWQFYRKYTEAMLRRYQTMSMEAGRVPSLLGRELFRGNVTHYKVKNFEDVVIFVHDVEKCVGMLSSGKQHLIRRIALQEYTQAETAAMLGLSLRTVIRNYNDALDRLTRIFLEKGLLEPLAVSAEAKRVL